MPVQQRLWIFAWRGPHAFRTLVEGKPSRVAVVGNGPAVFGAISSALASAEVRPFERDGVAVTGWADLVVFLPAADA